MSALNEKFANGWSNIQVTTHKAIQTVVLFTIVFYKVTEVLVLGGTSAWLLTQNHDIVSIGVGVSLGVWGLAKLVSLAYRSESFKNGSKR